MKNIITVILIFLALFMCSITATAQSEVGSIPGSFNVTPNGASAYQIPIEMPAGAGGLTPHISIQYNSQGGWGLLGFGWDLNGLSYITREGSTLAQDGHYSAVNYSTDDRLSLDGNRMVPISGAYWGESTQYGTENETFSRIETVKVGTSMCFKVTTKDGTILEYGFTADSRFLPIGSSTPYQWWLNKVRDKNGNYYTINYKNSGGQIVPQKIVYSKNEAVTTPGLEIQFTYNIANDRTAYIYGSLMRLANRLSSVKIVSEGATLKTYLYKYETLNEKYSALSGIQLQLANGVTLPETTIDWDVNTEPSEPVQIPNRLAKELVYGDFIGFGDGKSEIANYNANDSIIKLYHYNGNSLINYQTLTVKPKIKKVYAVDYNGDGLTDLAVLYTNVTTNKTHLSILQNTGYNFTEVTNLLLNGADEDKLYFRHVNDDNTIDLIWSDYAGFYIWFSCKESTQITVPRTNSNEQFYFSDFNGDGKADILSVKKARGIIPKFDFTVSTYKNASIVTLFTKTIESIEWPIHIGDFNGDGLTDIFYKTQQESNNEASFLFQCSTGKSFEQSSALRFIPINWYIDPFNITVLDLNGDGADDLLMKHAVDGNFDKELIGYSFNEEIIGNFFTDHALSIINMDAFNLSDLDGDGTADLLKVIYSQLYFQPAQSSHPLVKGISNGIGNTYSISYGSSANSSICTHNKTFAAPLTKFATSLPLVKRVTMPNGIGGSFEITYKYSNPAFHATSRSFLGFESFVTKNVTQDRTTEFHFEFSSTYRQPLLKYKLETVNKFPVLNQSNSYTFKTLSGGRFYKLLTSVQTHNMLTGITESTTYSFDSNANLTNTKYVNGAYTTSTSFLSYTGLPTPHLPGSIVTQYTKGGSTDLQTTETLAYDSKGNLTSSTRNSGTPQALTTLFYYDSFGNITKRIEKGSGQNREYSFTYDPSGRFLLTEKNPLGHVTTYTYNIAKGTLLTVTDPNGYTTSYQYDNLDRVKQVANPDGSQILTTYSWTNEAPNASYKVVTTSTNGSTATVYYDILGREVQRRESAPNNKTLVVASSYNDKGQLYHKSLPGFGAPSTEGVTYTYDSFGRLIRKVSPTEVLTYKYTGKTVEETNTLTGKSVVVESNEMGLPITTTTVQGTTTFSYNAFGAYKSISAGNIITTFGYDKAGNKVMVSNPNTGNASTTYNAWGQPLSTTDANGNHTSFTYDLAGRIVTLSQPEGNVSYTYDTKVKGAISSIAKSGHVQTFNYDLAKYGRLISLSENVDGQTFTRTLSYDDANHGRIKGMTYPNGFSISYAYDSQGFLSEILTAANKRIWARGNQTPLGQPINVSLGNGTSQQYTYDSQHNLTGITVAHNGTVHLNHKYSFSSATGNLTYREDALRGLRETFTYDNMDRLTHITGPSGLGQQVSYSPNGNINFKSDAGTYSYNAQQPNAVSQVSGSPVETNYLNTVLTQSITYNSLNKPTQISAGTNTLTLSYGVNQQRVKEQHYVSGGLKETRYLLGSYELIKKPGQPDEHHCYVISPNGPVAVNISTGTSAGTLSYIHTDYLGSIALITNSQGAKHEELSYDAWGNRRSPATWQPTPGVGSATLSRGYTFHQHYDHFGLINMNGRMYDPLLGRMLNADPIVANSTSAQSYNGYSYCMNNPLKYTDPSGYISIAAAMSPYDSDPETGRPMGMSSGASGGWASAFGSNELGITGSSIYYDEYTGTYRNRRTGKTVSFSEAIKSYEIYTFSIKYLVFSGTRDNPYMHLNDIVFSTDVKNVAQGGGDRDSYWAWALAATGVIIADDLTGIGVADDVAIPFIWAGAASIAVYKYMTKTTCQYVLTAKTDGSYPVYVWGSSSPVSYVDLKAGDVWKYGITSQYIPGTDNQWRYSQLQLNLWNVEFRRQYEGTRTGALIEENLRLTNYFGIYGTLPPGNKIFR